MRIAFEDRGIAVQDGLIWIDALRPKPFGVITHAHADHVARHQRILCTPETAAFLRMRIGGAARMLERRYGEPTTVGDCTITLVGAGHVLGSAMVHVEGPAGSLLYTGDVRLEGGLTCPPAEPVHAEILVMESTFGRSDHRMPPAEAVRADLVRFAREALESHQTPVFLAYALGKAQEVMCALGQAGIPVAAHGTVWGPCKVYREFGIRFPRSRRLQRTRTRRAAIVVPPRHLKATEVQAAAPLRVASVTGWGKRTLGAGVDANFRLSDHSDFDGLLRLVERVAPQRIFTLHGYAAELADTLRARGYDAEAVPGHSGPEEGTRPGMFGEMGS